MRGSRVAATTIKTGNFPDDRVARNRDQIPSNYVQVTQQIQATPVKTTTTTTTPTTVTTTSKIATEVKTTSKVTTDTKPVDEITISAKPSSTGRRPESNPKNKNVEYGNFPNREQPPNPRLVQDWANAPDSSQGPEFTNKGYVVNATDAQTGLAPHQSTYNISNITQFQSQRDEFRFQFDTKLCGFPGFCKPSAYEECTHKPLRDCDHCSMTAAAVFGGIFVLLGLLIIFTNLLVIVVARRSGAKDTFGKIKASLAVADMIIGLQFLIVAIYNFSWTLGSTSLELDSRQLAFRGSAVATAFGISILLPFAASLYHLMFLSGQRLYAVKWPFSYRLQKRRSVNLGLVGVWLVAALSASVPTWFPNHLVFTYQHTVFLFLISEKNVEEESRFAVLTVLSLFFVLPFLIMTLMTGLTALAVHNGLNRRPSIRDNDRQTMDKREVAAFKTVALMQVGFTLSLVPVVVVYTMYYTGKLTCDNVSVPFAVCFYLSMSNSLTNVIIYSARDATFSSSVAAILPCCKKHRHSSTNQSQATMSTKQTMDSRNVGNND